MITKYSFIKDRVLRRLRKNHSKVKSRELTKYFEIWIQTMVDRLLTNRTIKIDNFGTMYTVKRNKFWSHNFVKMQFCLSQPNLILFTPNYNFYQYIMDYERRQLIKQKIVYNSKKFMETNTRKNMKKPI